MASNISKVFVQERDLVKIGEPLAKLSCEDVKLDAQLAQTDFNRITRLFRKGSATQEALDHTTNEYNQAMLRLNWCDIGSPMNATVLYRSRNPRAKRPAPRLFCSHQLRSPPRRAIGKRAFRARQGFFYGGRQKQKRSF